MLVDFRFHIQTGYLHDDNTIIIIISRKLLRFITNQNLYTYVICAINLHFFVKVKNFLHLTVKSHFKLINGVDIALKGMIIISGTNAYISFQHNRIIVAHFFFLMTSLGLGPKPKANI